jgi:YD repeat-containing protein
MLLVAALVCAPAHAASSLYVYDELGRLVAEVEPAGETTRYTYDAAGNLISVSRVASTQLSIISFAAARGPVGETVRIFGVGFIPDAAQNAVAFNGTAAAVTSASLTEIVAVVPSGASSGPVGVTNANGSATSAQAFTIVPTATVAAIAPAFVTRGTTIRAEISGANLASASAVTFAQAGVTASVLSGATDALLGVDISIQPDVPFGSYSFSVTTDAGTVESGAVQITVSPTLTGTAVTVTRPLSVHLRAPATGVPSGNAMTVSPAISVHIRQAIPGAPSGNAVSVAPPVSVSMP